MLGLPAFLRCRLRWLFSFGVVVAICSYRIPHDGAVVADGPVGCFDEVSNSDFRYLDVGLPAEIARLKTSGHLDRAIAACDRLLEQDPDPSLAACLRAERHRMWELPRQFCVSRTRAIEMIRDEWPTFTEAQFDELIDHKRIDWRFIDGELRVLDNFLDSLRVYPHEVPGLKPESAVDTAARDAMLAGMHRDGGAARIITIRASIEVPGAQEGETVRAWLPIPAACPQQSQIEIIDATPGAAVAPADAPARTIFWSSRDAHRFEVTYRYRIDAAYTDAYAGAVPKLPIMDPPTSEDLAEDRPHIRFTPYLRDLTGRVIEGHGHALDRARAIYDFVTGSVDYRYQPAYSQLDSIAENCARSLRGDCGVMALTFITMCRIAGIPARWQSGLYVAPDHIGPHDWARFFTPESGWLWADCSFGSSSRRNGEMERRRHHFGNLDPWRMVANSRFQAPLAPESIGIREDPYDNQMGEASVDDRGCRCFEMLRTVELLSMDEIPFGA